MDCGRWAVSSLPGEATGGAVKGTSDQWDKHNEVKTAL